ncbi:hypothetical protein FNV43_RR05548 [Rhamnella rubrinervis]|uniref:Uncharacterized protein n=1 Tax=Rhamnella rubrinervis TaxID=2594499 RepID=A0A8K0HNZ3_9ROSA|nr:hypothetical protein FNV43_RR05548 [Rhamnella rubrinervis]
MTHSQQPLDDFNNQVRHVHSCIRNNNLSRGFSTAQMCLKRILEIISTVEPPTPLCYRGLGSEEKEEDEGLSDDANGGGGCGVDLNLGLGPEEAEEVEESDQLKSSEGECEPKDEVGNAVHGIVEVAGDGEELELELKHEDEEGDDGGIRNAKFGTKTSPFKRREAYDGSDCLGLLVEAARMISSNTEDDKSDDCGEESGSGSKKRKESSGWMVMRLYGESPVVRSKRGRNQALPSRLRDSVLEPWKRVPRPQRSKQ